MVGINPNQFFIKKIYTQTFILDFVLSIKIQISAYRIYTQIQMIGFRLSEYINSDC